MPKTSFINWENAPIKKEGFIAIFIFMSGLIGNKIQELLSKHIINEEQEMSKLQERVKFYEKEFNINPLSWRKKKK